MTGQFDEVAMLRHGLAMMEKRPRTVLCVCGSRSLGGRAQSEKWARRQIEEVYRHSYDPHRDVVLSGGAMGPDLWARELCPWPGRFVEYLPSGDRLEWVSQQYRDWGIRKGRWAETAQHPLARNLAMAEGLAAAMQAGWKAGLLALVDPGSRTQGSMHMVQACRERGVAVLLRQYCP